MKAKKNLGKRLFDLKIYIQCCDGYLNAKQIAFLFGGMSGLVLRRHMEDYETSCAHALAYLCVMIKRFIETWPNPDDPPNYEFFFELADAYYSFLDTQIESAVLKEENKNLLEEDLKELFEIVRNLYKNDLLTFFMDAQIPSRPFTDLIKNFDPDNKDIERFRIEKGLSRLKDEVMKWGRHRYSYMQEGIYQKTLLYFSQIRNQLIPEIEQKVQGRL
jgi:hypothetical protein